MKETILQLLTSVKKGKLTPEDACARLSSTGLNSMGSTKLDFGRESRIQIPEVVYGKGKSLHQLEKIVEKYLKLKKNLLITKCDTEKVDNLKNKYQDLHFSRTAGMLWCRFESNPQADNKAYAAVISAGTSDMPVFLEAVLTLKFMDVPVKYYSDCGVAGIHRVMNYADDLKNAACIIVVAGMEGALASVVSGLTGRPVVGVPTSIGYGACLNGLTPLFGMINSCSPTVSVVNIDNGFGAACFATSIYRGMK